MTCQNATAPRNITNSKNTCLLKCRYMYDYGNSSCTVKNNIDNLTILKNREIGVHNKSYTLWEHRCG